MATVRNNRIEVILKEKRAFPLDKIVSGSFNADTRYWRNFQGDLLWKRGVFFYQEKEKNNCADGENSFHLK